MTRPQKRIIGVSVFALAAVAITVALWTSILELFGPRPLDELEFAWAFFRFMLGLGFVWALFFVRRSRNGRYYVALPDRDVLVITILLALAFIWFVPRDAFSHEGCLPAGNVEVHSKLCGPGLLQSGGVCQQDFDFVHEGPGEGIDFSAFLTASGLYYFNQANECVISHYARSSGTLPLTGVSSVSCRYVESDRECNEGELSACPATYVLYDAGRQGQRCGLPDDEGGYSSSRQQGEFCVVPGSDGNTDTNANAGIRVVGVLDPPTSGAGSVLAPHFCPSVCSISGYRAPDTGCPSTFNLSPLGVNSVTRRSGILDFGGFMGTDPRQNFPGSYSAESDGSCRQPTGPNSPLWIFNSGVVEHPWVPIGCDGATCYVVANSAFRSTRLACAEYYDSTSYQITAFAVDEGAAVCTHTYGAPESSAVTDILHVTNSASGHPSSVTPAFAYPPNYGIVDIRPDLREASRYRAGCTDILAPNFDPCAGTNICIGNSNAISSRQYNGARLIALYGARLSGGDGAFYNSLPDCPDIISAAGGGFSLLGAHSRGEFLRAQVVGVNSSGVATPALVSVLAVGPILADCGYVVGCMDSQASNYDSEADIDSGACEYPDAESGDDCLIAPADGRNSGNRKICAEAPPPRNEDGSLDLNIGLGGPFDLVSNFPVDLPAIDPEENPDLLKVLPGGINVSTAANFFDLARYQILATQYSPSDIWLSAFPQLPVALNAIESPDTILSLFAIHPVQQVQVDAASGLAEYVGNLVSSPLRVAFGPFFADVKRLGSAADIDGNYPECPRDFLSFDWDGRTDGIYSQCPAARSGETCLQTDDAECVRLYESYDGGGIDFNVAQYATDRCPRSMTPFRLTLNAAPFFCDVIDPAFPWMRVIFITLGVISIIWTTLDLVRRPA